MKRIVQDLKNGDTRVTECPSPTPSAGQVLIQSRASLISAGTERMLVEFGKASLLGKARAQPDKVKQVLDKLRSDGILPTVETVFNRLDEPLPLGYCNAGTVVEVGPGVTAFRRGDRVASNGPHAEIVAVPANLCARIPDGVPFEHAAFTVLSSIGLQGVRLAKPELGERVVVYGLGLIGLITVQLLRANGCEPFGIDLSPARLELAQQFGASVAGPGADPVAAAIAWTEGKGVDAVVITASAKTADIVHNAAAMCRKRGRIVLVGVVGLDLRRSDFYEKELTFQVSCSYGPGRYDDAYELAGRDYPLGFVRWTEQRNFEAVLQLLAGGRLVVDKLVTDRFPLDRAADAYDKIRGDSGALGVILEYPKESPPTRSIALRPRNAPAVQEPALAVIGAGNFSKMTLMPALAKAGARVRAVCDLNGGAAAHLARKFDADTAVSDAAIVLEDPGVDAVLIAVGHSAHARLVCDALASNKHVFVEKPLAMTVAQLAQIVAAAERRRSLQVMVGFNRRFSAHVVRIRELLAGRGEPLAMSMTVNAGIVPPEHWVHDPERGGGRIVGEACHFIDLMVHLTGSRVVSVSSAMMGPGPAVRGDKLAMVLAFADGSVGTVNYFANGAKAYPKESLEVFSDGRVLRLSNFQRLDGYGFKGFKSHKTLSQDKGHAAEVAAFIRQLRSGGNALISLDTLVNVTLASFAAVTSADEGRLIRLDDEYGAALASAVAVASAEAAGDESVMTVA